MASFGPKIAVVLLLSLLLVLSAAQRQRKPGNSVSIKAADRLISRHRADDNDQEDDTDNPGTANKFKEGRCSYYCFFVPLKDEKVNFHPYTSINCSHLVYGFATINPQNELDPVTSFDMLYSDSFANYRQVTDLGKGLQMQVLLGIRGDGQKDQFMETQWTHEKVIKSIVWNTRSNNFGGIFLDFQTHHLLSTSFEGFMDKLSAAINADHEQYPQQNRLVVVLGMSARWVPKVTGRMSKLAKHFHAFYLWNDDINTSQDPSISVQVDPLGPSEKVPLMDTIKGNAEKLASGGIPKSKIIVGLTAWARSYVFAKNVKGEHGATIDNVGDPGDVTKKTDGRLAYYEICKLVGFNQTIYERNSSTTSFTGAHNQWYSFNMPKHDSFQRKLKWISSYGFGGVGLFSLQADDALGNVCGEGVLPLHTYVFQAYSCSIRRSDETRGKESGSQACTRLCSFNPDHATNSFNFITLDPNWCSHIILSTATVVSYPSLDVSFSQKSRKIVMNYNAWSTPAKPYLILSIGADQGPESWRQALQTTKRPAFIDKLVKLMEDNGADGVDIAWTSVENALDMTLLYALLTDLRANVTNTKQIFVCASHSATFYRQFNYKLLANMADYVVLQGYRFHAYNRPFTGHHSPLFGTRDVFNDPKLTIEGMVGKWLENVPSEKLIVALSAEAMSQFFRIIGNRSDRAIGDPANSQKQITSRTNSPGKVTQTELCQILKNPNAQTQFIEAIGAPYLISGDEFIAYDDDKSMLIKSVWASMQDLGGIALHGMEMDNIAGECPSGSPFHLLKSIVKAQMCNQCTDPTQPIVFPVGTNATDLLQGIASQTSRLMNVTESSCGHRFRVVCTYHLPTDSASTGLSMDSLPYDKCDEIVVQKFRLTASGKVEAEEALPKETLANLTSMITKNKLKTRFISSIHCFMSVEQLKKLLDKPSSSLVNEVIEHTKTYGTSGIELRCGHILRPETKQKFSGLLRDLQEGLHAQPVDHNKCHKTVGMKIYAWRTDLPTIYEIPTLNKLHHISMETFQVSTIKQVMLVEPLFDPNNQHLSIDSILSKWLKSGLKREVLVIELPSYGLTKKLFGSPAQARSNPKGGIQDVKEMMGVDKISQEEICELLKKEIKPKNTTLYPYEMIIDYKQTIDTAVSFESAQTITYKTRYAMREQLAGIALSALHQDDYSNKCGKGAFPLLQAVNTATKCNKPTTPIAIETKEIQPTNP